MPSSMTEDVNRFREVVPGRAILTRLKGEAIAEELTAHPGKMLSASSGSCKQLLLQSFVDEPLD